MYISQNMVEDALLSMIGTRFDSPGIKKELSNCFGFFEQEVTVVLDGDDGKVQIDGIDPVYLSLAKLEMGALGNYLLISGIKRVVG